MGQVVYSYEAFMTSPDNYKAETSHVLCAYMGNNDMKYKGNYLGGYGLAVRQVTGRYVIEVLGNKTLYAVGASGPNGVGHSTTGVLVNSGATVHCYLTGGR